MNEIQLAPFKTKRKQKKYLKNSKKFLKQCAYIFNKFYQKVLIYLHVKNAYKKTINLNVKN